MAIFGTNTFEYEPTIRVVKHGDQIAHIPSIRIRSKDVVISVLGVSLGSWTPWQWVDDPQIYRLDDGTLCDENGNT